MNNTEKNEQPPAGEELTPAPIEALKTPAAKAEDQWDRLLRTTERVIERDVLATIGARLNLHFKLVRR